MGFIPDIQDWFDIRNIINLLYHSNRLEKENNVIISTDEEKKLMKVKVIHEKKT